jgi:hypothetical protein
MALTLSKAWLATADFRNLMGLADFEVISQEQRQLLPRRWLGLGPFINRATAGCQAAVPADLSHRTAGPPFPDRKFSASILIPCSNERGNIENAIRRMPRFGSSQEILFVEGIPATARSRNANGYAMSTRTAGTSRS